MVSHVERLIIFLEKLLENQNLPKMLHEDIEWAIEVISENLMYSGNMKNVKFNIDREEISAWLDRIHLKSIP
jgi:hypothetical protein